jgi:hypothetical protein
MIVNVPRISNLDIIVHGVRLFDSIESVRASNHKWRSVVE